MISLLGGLLSDDVLEEFLVKDAYGDNPFNMKHLRKKIVLHLASKHLDKAVSDKVKLQQDYADLQSKLDKV